MVITLHNNKTLRPLLLPLPKRKTHNGDPPLPNNRTPHHLLTIQRNPHRKTILQQHQNRLRPAPRPQNVMGDPLPQFTKMITIDILHLNNNHLQLYFGWNSMNKNRPRGLFRNSNKLTFKYPLITSKDRRLWSTARSFIKISILSKNYYPRSLKGWSPFQNNFKS